MTVSRIFMFFIIITALLVPSVTHAQTGSGEVIRNFHSDITVNKDTSLTVKETIDVTSAGDKIRHGIYRDFPTKYKTLLSVKKVGFKVLSVRRDGKPEPYSLEEEQNGIRVYMGDANTLILPGKYSYELTYRTDHQLGFFKNHDELYWNATGNGWEFSILKASASVTLPPEIPADKMTTEGYTGPQDVKGKKYTSSVDSSGHAQFATTKMLPQNNGLTIVVTWPKGYIKPLTASQEISLKLKSDIGIRYELIGLAILLIYYASTWALIGKDPPKGSIVPQYEAPDGLSPAAVRYIWRMRFDEKCFTASLINTAIRKFIKIEKIKRTYTLIWNKENTEIPNDEEKLITDGLFAKKDTIRLASVNWQMISSTRKSIGNLLKKNYQKRYFSTNRLLVIPGVIIAILTLTAGLLNDSTSGFHGLLLGILPTGGDITIGLSLWTLCTIAFIAYIAGVWKTAGKRTGMTDSTDIVMNVGCIITFVVFLALGEIIGMIFLSRIIGPIHVLALLVCAVSVYLFYKVIPAYTKEGRALLDKIDGLREYLAVAESDNLAMFKGPEITPALFEKFLPYAFALDVVQAWSQKFSDVLDEAGQSPDAGKYMPTWYSGDMGKLTAGGFASGLVSSFSDAISSSSSPPGSSSGSSGGGSGGGGSSGGGGGGGGGGGW